jgi:hypothetical protein
MDSPADRRARMEVRVFASRPAPTGSIKALRADLEAMLIAEGLCPREARTMVETWRDSWFEEGTRVFYIIPKAAIDQRLPLSISPTPAGAARAFVRRLELVTREMKKDVEHAIVENNLDELNRYGRFLGSIVLQISERPSIVEIPLGLAAPSEPSPCRIRRPPRVSRLKRRPLRT